MCCVIWMHSKITRIKSKVRSRPKREAVVTTLRKLRGGSCHRSRNVKIELSYEASQDAWSFGSVLFELCTGRNLFPLDLNDDSMVEEEDLTRLCSWSCLDDKSLDGVFKNCETCDPETRAQAQHLIRWCLQGDPSERPSFQKILQHPFLSQSFDRPRTRKMIEESEEKEEETNEETDETSSKSSKHSQNFQF